MNSRAFLARISNYRGKTQYESCCLIIKIELTPLNFKMQYVSVLEIFLNKRKAVNGTANRVFLCVNSIYNPFVYPKLINTTHPEKWGTLYMHYYAKK